MDLQYRAQDALRKDPDSVLNTHIEAHNHLQLHKIQCYLPASADSRHKHGTHTYMEAKYSHT